MQSSVLVIPGIKLDAVDFVIFMFIQNELSFNMTKVRSFIGEYVTYLIQKVTSFTHSFRTFRNSFFHPKLPMAMPLPAKYSINVHYYPAKPVKTESIGKNKVSFREEHTSELQSRS